MSPHPASRTASCLALSSVAVAVILLSACGPSPTGTPPATTPASIVPSPTAAAQASEPPTAAVPGSIEIQPCPAPTAAGTLCLGDATGTIQAEVKRGSNLTISLDVTNPGGTASSPVAVLVYLLDVGTLPLGQPACTACSSTSSKSVIGLEWPALGPGEMRALSVPIPVTGDPGVTAFFIDLYARPVADVTADEIANGIQPGQQSWKVALTIDAP